MWIPTPTRSFGFEPSSIDLLVLSHAHIDHSGLIPRLVAEGFAGPIYSTPATHDLCTIMLADSAHIQEYDHAYDLKRARKKGKEPEADGPLYTVADVEPALDLFVELAYETTEEVARASHSPIRMRAIFSEVLPYTSR